jgi:hypothetical protein
MNGEPGVSGEIDATRWLNREVRLEDLEGAARGIQKMAEDAECFPELYEKIMELRKMLAEAANVFAGGDRKKSTEIYNDLKKKRAALVCGEAA